jgi:ATP-binding cassette subfamily F protein 3
MLERFPGEGTYDHEQELRRHLNGCGIGADLCMAPIRGLSGGQRARVSMAAVSFARPHVLILDEPTNNLDIEAVTALVDCIQKFQGGVVVVSHDQYFVSSIANTVLLVGEEPGKVTTAPSFEGYVKQKQSNMASM